jgi:hypothetical protein
MLGTHGKKRLFEQMLGTQTLEMGKNSCWAQTHQLIFI